MSLTSLPGFAFSEIVFYVGETADLIRLWLTGDKTLKWTSVESFRFGTDSPRFATWPPFLSANNVHPYEVFIGPGKYGLPTHWCHLDFSSLGNRVTNLSLEVATKIYGFPAPLRSLFPELQRLRLSYMGYVRPSDLAHLPKTVIRIELEDLRFGVEGAWGSSNDSQGDDDESTKLASTSLDAGDTKPWNAPDTLWHANEFKFRTQPLIELGAPIDIILETLPENLEYLSIRGRPFMAKQRVPKPTDAEEGEEVEDFSDEIEFADPIQWPLTLQYLELEINSIARINIFGLPIVEEIGDQQLAAASKSEQRVEILPALQTLKFMSMYLVGDNPSPPIEKSFWNHIPRSLTELNLDLSMVMFSYMDHEITLPSVSDLPSIKWPPCLNTFEWQHSLDVEEGWLSAFYDQNIQLEHCTLNKSWGGTEFNNNFSEHPPRAKTIYSQQDSQDLRDLPISVDELLYLTYGEDPLATAHPDIHALIQQEETNWLDEIPSDKPAPLYPELLAFSLRTLTLSVSAADTLHLALPNTLTTLELESTALPRNCPPLPATLTRLSLHSRALPFGPGVGLKLLPAGLKSLTFGALDYRGSSHTAIWDVIALCPGDVGSKDIDETRRLPESLTFLDFESRTITKGLAQWIAALPGTMPLEFLKLKGFRQSEVDCQWSLTVPTQLAHSTTLKSMELRVYGASPSDFAFLPRKLRVLTIHGHPCEMKHLNDFHVSLFPKTLSRIYFSFPTDTKPDDWILRGLPVPWKEQSQNFNF